MQYMLSLIHDWPARRRTVDLHTRCHAAAERCTLKLHVEDDMMSLPLLGDRGSRRFLLLYVHPLSKPRQNIVYLSAELNRLCWIRVSTDISIRDLSSVGGLIVPLYSVGAHRNATLWVQSISFRTSVKDPLARFAPPLPPQGACASCIRRSTHGQHGQFS